MLFQPLGISGSNVLYWLVQHIFGQQLVHDAIHQASHVICRALLTPRHPPCLLCQGIQLLGQPALTHSNSFSNSFIRSFVSSFMHPLIRFLGLARTMWVIDGWSLMRVISCLTSECMHGYGLLCIRCCTAIAVTCILTNTSSAECLLMQPLRQHLHCLACLALLLHVVRPVRSCDNMMPVILHPCMMMPIPAGCTAQLGSSVSCKYCFGHQDSRLSQLTTRRAVHSMLQMPVGWHVTGN